MWSDFEYDDDTEKVRDLNGEADYETEKMLCHTIKPQNLLSPISHRLPWFTSGFT